MTAAKVITKRFVVCPGCGEHEFAIEHMMSEAGREVGPWRCEVTNCRMQVWMRVGADGTVDITQTKQAEPNGYALCKLRDLYLVFREPYGRIEVDHADYFYHSHQCPTNMMRNLVQVYGPSGEPDTHGLIRFVANIEDTEGARDMLDPDPGPGVSLRKVFELFKTDGTPIDSPEFPEENEGAMQLVAEMRRQNRTS